MYAQIYMAPAVKKLWIGMIQTHTQVQHLLHHKLLLVEFFTVENFLVSDFPFYRQLANENTYILKFRTVASLFYVVLHYNTPFIVQNGQ